MANITAQDIFSPVYLLSQSDPVEGGDLGVSNIPHKQLANRTLNVKKILDAHVANAGDPHEAAGYLKTTAFTAHVADPADPHFLAGYAKLTAVNSHIADTNAPHVSAGYGKALAFATHVSDTNNPHAAAAYLKQSTFASHAGSIEDPHAAAGYLKMEDIPKLPGIYHATFDGAGLATSFGFTSAVATNQTGIEGLIMPGVKGNVTDIEFTFTAAIASAYSVSVSGFGCCQTGGDNPDVIVPIVVLSKSTTSVVLRQYRNARAGSGIGTWSSTVGLIVAAS